MGQWVSTTNPVAAERERPVRKLMARIAKQKKEMEERVKNGESIEGREIDTDRMLKDILEEENTERKKEEKKLRAHMGEEEWARMEGHTCNECAREAGLWIRCRCTKACSRHTGAAFKWPKHPSEYPVGRAGRPMGL